MSLVDPTGFVADPDQPPDESIDEITVIGSRLGAGLGMRASLAAALSGATVVDNLNLESIDLGDKNLQIASPALFSNVTVTGKRKSGSFVPGVEFTGKSGVIYLGIVEGMMMSGVFDERGNAGVVAQRAACVPKSSSLFGDVIDITGLFTGAALLNVISGDGSRWRSLRNWKWNNSSFGGNQYTGSRATSVSLGKYIKFAGSSLYVAAAGLAVYNGGVAAYNRDSGGVVKAIGDLGFGTYASFGGWPGIVGGVSYYGTSYLVRIPSVYAITVAPIVDGICAVSGGC